MTFDVQALQQQLPYYLNADPAQKIFLSELKALSNGATRGYFLPRQFDSHVDTVLQGDGWTGFQIFSFPAGEKHNVRGIVLSNSCDVSVDNKRTIPLKVVFAPIVKLTGIEKKFRESGLGNEPVEAKLQAIRSQTVTNMFYLPAEDPLTEEYVALLDDVHSMPIEALNGVGKKLFTLSMAGFYLFIFKLSVHFCRLQEGMDRSIKPLV